MTFLIDPYRRAAAAPLIWDIGSGGSIGRAASGNVTLDLPFGAAGNLLVAAGAFRGNAAFTAPAGWSMIAQTLSAGTADGGPPSGFLAWRFRDGSEPYPSTLTFSRSGGSFANIVCYSLVPSQSVPGMVVDAFVTTLDTTADLSTTGNGMTLSAGNALVLAQVVASIDHFDFDTAFVAAGLAAGPAADIFPSTQIPTANWGAWYFSEPSTPKVSQHLFGLCGVPAGATGAFSRTNPANTQALVMAAAFRPAP